MHVHNGPVVGSIVSGSVSFQVEGEPETVLGPGDVFFEPEGARTARFDARDDGVAFLAYFLLGPGQEPATSFPGELGAARPESPARRKRSGHAAIRASARVTRAHRTGCYVWLPAGVAHAPRGCSCGRMSRS
jgi:quercetin dioxygenase-like cupin family protein